LNLNQSFKSKSKIFSNSNQFKPSPKTEIWDFLNMRILKLKSKFKSRTI
jgi:hypothetical protein